MKKLLVVTAFALGSSMAAASDGKKLSLAELDLISAGASASASGSASCSVNRRAGLRCGADSNSNSRGQYETAHADVYGDVSGTSLVLSSNLGGGHNGLSRIGGGTQYIAASAYEGYAGFSASASAKSMNKKKRNNKKRRAR
ncbi:MAG: hypothetical protein AAF404_06920 [Pseudomonadota bacterium]